MIADDALNVAAAVGVLFLIIVVAGLAGVVWNNIAWSREVERVSDVVKLRERLHQIEMQCTELSAKVACLMRRNDRLL